MVELLLDTIFAGTAGWLIGLHTSPTTGFGITLGLALIFNNMRLIRLAIERNHKE